MNSYLRTSCYAVLLATAAAAGVAGCAWPGVKFDQQSLNEATQQPAPFFANLPHHQQQTHAGSPAMPAAPQLMVPHSRFHPVPTRPVFAPSSPPNGAPLFSDDGTIQSPATTSRRRGADESGDEPPPPPEETASGVRVVSIKNKDAAQSSSGDGWTQRRLHR